MARCGRCGLWAKTPKDEREQKFAGVCLWYQSRLIPEEEYESRECKDFFERIPKYTAMEHFNYKVKRDNLGDAYVKAKYSYKISLIAISISIISLLIKLGGLL